MKIEPVDHSHPPGVCRLNAGHCTHTPEDCPHLRAFGQADGCYTRGHHSRDMHKRYCLTGQSPYTPGGHHDPAQRPHPARRSDAHPAPR